MSFFLLFILFSSNIFGQNVDKNIFYDSTYFDILQKTIYLPSPIKPFKFKHAVHLSIVSLPKDWLESNINIPFPYYKVKMGLPFHFVAEASIGTIIVSTEAIVGIKFCQSIGRFHFGLGNDLNFNFGWLDGYGFDNSTLFAWDNEPNISIGGNFDNMALTAYFKTHIMMDYFINNGGNKTNQSKNVFNGYTIGFNIEQRLFKNKVASFGIAINEARFHI
ncbi:MAG: hypothetical protein IPK03_16350 [Bacteroidetes bacterium]|nr:hypothetical protein [Bacteroidota bacterium]